MANVGLIIFAFSVYLTIKADLGLSPWAALHQAIADKTGLSLGTVTNLVSFAVIIVDLLLHESIGWGTLADALMVGWAIDFFNWLDPIATPQGMVLRLVLMLLSLIPAAYGQYLYMSTALSCGPRDNLFVGLSRRAKKIAPGAMQVLICVVVTAAAWLLKGPIGIGTLVSAFGIGFTLDIICKLLKVDLTGIEHEGFIGTHKAVVSWFRNRKAGK